MSRGRFLAEFELYVMLAIKHLGDEAYAVAIRRGIETRTGRPVSIGAIYATVARLEEKGLVEHGVTDPRPVPGGRSRKRFELTGAGERALAHSAGMLLRMVRGLDLEGLEAWAP
jgi:DNA-binding PadR family transcriptional regulator